MTALDILLLVCEIIIIIYFIATCICFIADIIEKRKLKQDKIWELQRRIEELENKSKVDDTQKQSVKDYEIEIREIYPILKSDGFCVIVEWAGNIGYGEFTIQYDANNKKWIYDNECMGKNFVKQCVCKCIDILMEDVGE